MASQPRYVRYILFAFLVVVLIFFISSSSTREYGAGHLQSASDLLKSQSLWQGTSDKQGSGFVQDSSAKWVEGQVVNPSFGGKPELSTPRTSKSSGLTTENSSPNPATGQSQFPAMKAPGERMNATFVTLARNSDVWEISKSIRQVEDRFNRNYNYDWVFLNDDDFDETFKKITTSLTSGRARFGKIGSEHWGFPDFIDQEKAKKVREDMHERKIIYGDSISYRHMCRYESGFFFQHKLMLEYEWYWRVEPSIELYCDIAYDPFKMMVDRKKKYGFVISLYEYIETIPTLWNSVKKFMKQHPEHIAHHNSMDFLSDDHGATYNNCHFWSNFEIGSLEWLRSKAYTDYFDSLDHDGGFFYERWGDAPIHSIAAALMLNKDEIHYFNDIAYYHVPFTHCPTGEQLRLDLKCHCNPKDNFDWNGYSCTKKWYEVNNWVLPEGYEKEQ